MAFVDTAFLYLPVINQSITHSLSSCLPPSDRLSAVHDQSSLSFLLLYHKYVLAMCHKVADAHTNSGACLDAVECALHGVWRTDDWRQQLSEIVHECSSRAVDLRVGLQKCWIGAVVVQSRPSRIDKHTGMHKDARLAIAVFLTAGTCERVG
jgi:hypothetical protein